jgi:hypothetical protein
MCRWLAYSGSPLLPKSWYKPEHSLIDQSLHARLGPHTTNGDGFGVGWYNDPQGRFFTAASIRPGTIRICVSADTFVRDLCSRISALRPGRRCSTPIATVPAWQMVVDAQWPDQQFRRHKAELVLE